jgi:hypothetical protein
MKLRIYKGFAQAGEKVESSTPAVAAIGKDLSDEIRQFHEVAPSVRVQFSLG